MKDIIKRLRTTYFIMVIPIFLLIFTIFALHKYKILIAFNSKYIGYIGLFLFVLSATFGIALPILMRNLFRYKAIKKGDIDISLFFNFENKTLFITLISGYIANIAYILLVPKLHLYGSIIIALYAIYVSYPEKKKIIVDLKTFGMDIKDIQEVNNGYK
ncbi:MAG: hypothetical protein GWP03_06970 [Proteobacteria bacterium]|nr:hypothetical protein [Pseudomonadota bacterium]